MSGFAVSRGAAICGISLLADCDKTPVMERKTIVDDLDGNEKSSTEMAAICQTNVNETGLVMAENKTETVQDDVGNVEVG